MKRILYLLSLIAFLLIKGNAQQCLDKGGCTSPSLFVKPYPNTGTPFSTTSSTFSLVNGNNSMNAGNYTLFSVNDGDTYEWSYCETHGGVSTSWDAQLTLFKESNLSSPICFSTDQCGTNAPYISWKANFTGTVRILTTVFNNGSGCKTNSGSPYNKLVWRKVPSYNLTIAVKNVDGSSRSYATAILFNSDYTKRLQTLPTNSSGIVTFTGLENGTYNYEVFYTPQGKNPPIDNEEFWGASRVIINGGSKSESFTRIEPYIYDKASFSPLSIKLKETSKGTFKVRHGLSNFKTSYIKVFVDRNQIYPYDKNGISSQASIAPGGNFPFSVNISPDNIGPHKFYAFVYSQIEGNNFKITDQYDWTDAFTATCPVLNTPTSPTPGLATQPGALVSDLNPTFSWSGDVAGVYHIQIWDATTNPATDNNVIYGLESPSSSPGHCVSGLSEKIPDGVLVNGKQYKWSVHRNDPCGECQSGNTTLLYFNVNTSPGCTKPGIPSNIAGSPGQTTADLSWNAGDPVGSATVTYYWVVGTSSSVEYNSANRIDQGFTQGTSAYTSKLSPGTTYYLRVYACTDCGIGSCSPGYGTSSSFQTSTNPPLQPIANFHSNLHNIAPGTTVPFYDDSENATSWEWMFYGATGYDAHSSSPTPTYNTPGVYRVTLTVSNGQNFSSKTKKGYIRVSTDATHQVITPASTAINTKNHQATIAEPIQIGTSTYEYSHTDFKIPVINGALNFTRFYNSLNGSSDWGLGFGWSHSYNYSLKSEEDTMWNIHYPDGHIEVFVPHYNDPVSYPWTSFGLYSGTVDSLVMINSSTYILYAKDNHQYQFNISGQLTQITDLNNNITALNYNGNDLTGINGQGGRSLTISYNANHKIENVYDPLNRSCNFSYDANGNLQTVLDAKTNPTNFKYNDSHLITLITNPLGDTLVSNDYDAQNRIIIQRDGNSKPTKIDYNTPLNGDATITNPDTSQIIVHHDDSYRKTFMKDELSFTNIFSYDHNSNEVLFTNENGNTETKLFDSHSNQTLSTKADNTFTEGIYNSFNSPTQIKDANGNITLFNYDGVSNNLNSIQFADNTYNYFYYNSAGQVTSTKDGRNNTTSYNYSPSGDLLSTTNPIGTKQYSYDAAGRLSAITDENLHTSHFAYDDNDNITSITDPLGRIDSFTYDANNQLLLSIDKMGFVTQFAYDKKGRLKSKINPKGGTTFYEYNTRDKLISITDPLNNIIRFEYDKKGRKISAANALGATQYQYDSIGNLKKIIDPTNKIITYSYTKTNRVNTVTDGLNNTTSYIYDNNGNLKLTINPLGKRTANTYDVMNRLASVLDASNNTTSITYDANGNKTAITDANTHTQSYTYDPANRVINFKDAADNECIYDYDPAGNNIAITKPTGVITKVYDSANRVKLESISSGDSYAFQYDNNDNILLMSNNSGTTKMIYDSLNQVTQYLNPFNQQVSFGYDAAGNKTSVTYPGNQTVNYTYDAANNLKTVTDWLSHTFTYTYDAAGRNTKLLYPNGIHTDYTFDDAARLSDKKNTLNSNKILTQSTFTLDPIGNRIKEIKIGLLPSSLPQSSNTYTYGKDDRMLTNSVWNYTNDNSGNRISETNGTTIANYTFTVDNLLRNSTDTTGAIASFTYNPFGHRLSKTNSSGSIRYVLDISDGLSKVLQTSDTNGTVKSHYVYGLGLLERIDSANNGLYYHFDAQHNTVALTDANDSTIDAYTYDPFGVLLAHTGNTEQPFTFLGEFGVEQESTTQYYVRARYYDAANGRFLSKDAFPFALNNPQTINRYVYSTNNPISNFDYNGFYGSQDDNILDWSHGILDLAEEFDEAFKKSNQFVGYYKGNFKFWSNNFYGNQKISASIVKLQKERFKGFGTAIESLGKIVGLYELHKNGNESAKLYSSGNITLTEHIGNLSLSVLDVYSGGGLYDYKKDVGKTVDDYMNYKITGGEVIGNIVTGGIRAIVPGYSFIEDHITTPFLNWENRKIDQLYNWIIK